MDVPGAAPRGCSGRKEALKVDKARRTGTDAFDFSQDAQDFRAQLWRRIQAQMTTPSVQELEDDDLEWVSAAGMPVNPDDKPGSL